MPEYHETLMPLDLGDPRPDPEKFTLEHWLYLHRRGTAPEPPTYLAPFPLSVHTDEQLHRTLTEWRVIDTAGSPTPELRGLMESLSTGFSAAVWGHVRFPLRAHIRSWDVPVEAREQGWGMPEETLVVPQVPFLITRAEGRTTLATSDDTALTVQHFGTSSSEAEDFAGALWTILDPDRAWSALDIPNVRVPRDMLDALSEDDEVASLRQDPDFDRRVEKVFAAAAESQVSDDTADELTKVLDAQPAAIAQFTASVPSESGVIADGTDAASLIFTAGEDGAVFAAHTVRDYAGYSSVVYRPGDDEGLTACADAVLAEARRLVS